MPDPSFIHYSVQPVERVYSVAQIERPHFKPRGLWFSVEDGTGDGWREWCEGEQFHLENLVCAHEVTLRRDADVLWLRDAAAIDKLTGELGRDLMAEIASRAGSALSAELLLDKGTRLNYIDWSAVARRHHGIIIAPYIWERRLSCCASWYYAWDCASGCIWDASAIESVRLRERADA